MYRGGEGKDKSSMKLDVGHFVCLVKKSFISLLMIKHKVCCCFIWPVSIQLTRIISLLCRLMQIIILLCQPSNNQDLCRWWCLSRLTNSSRPSPTTSSSHSPWQTSSSEPSLFLCSRCSWSWRSGPSPPTSATPSSPLTILPATRVCGTWWWYLLTDTSLSPDLSPTEPPELPWR